MSDRTCYLMIAFAVVGVMFAWLAMAYFGAERQAYAVPLGFALMIAAPAFAQLDINSWRK